MRIADLLCPSLTGVSLAVLLLAGGPGCACPMENVHSHITQPDGSSIPCLVSGDEYNRTVEDTRGFTLLRDPRTGWVVYAGRQNGRIVATAARAGSADPARLGLVPHLRPDAPPKPDKPAPPRLRRTPRSGAMNNLVVFVRFADEAEFPEGQSAFEPLFNGSPGTSSLRTYYREVSYGKLDVTSTLVPATPDGSILSYQDSHPRGYFEPYDAAANPDGYTSDGTARERQLVTNAVNALGTQVPSGLNLDADGDGVVDHITLVVRGEPSAWGGVLWPHQYALWPAAALGALSVQSYDVQMENVLVRQNNVGALCHEFFHALGAPDLYHYTYDGVDPVGRFDLMGIPANTPQHMGAYMKWRYGGWIDTTPEVYRTGTYTLSPLVSSPECCVKVKSPNIESEYFVLEYRRQAGLFDASVLGSGLLVYRINMSTAGGDGSGPPDEVYLYRPGGTRTVNGYLSLAPFSADSGRTAMNDKTDPASFLTGGMPGGLDVSDVGPAGDTISFTVTFNTPEYRLVFLSAPDGGFAGLPLDRQPQVAVRDLYGKTAPVTGLPVTLSLVPNCGAPDARLLGTTSLETREGIVAFSGIAVDTSGTGYQLRASAPDMISATCRAFSVQSDAVAQTIRVSVDASGQSMAGLVDAVAISADGNVVAFTDTADLTGANASGIAQVYLYDRRTGAIQCQSLGYDGSPANSGCATPSLSADGRYVAFVSRATNLAPAGNGWPHIYWRDTVAGETRLVSCASDGTPGNQYSRSPSISDDGRYVAFSSYASNLVPNDTNGSLDAFVHDIQTGVTRCASVLANGKPFGSADAPQISGDGRFIAYTAQGWKFNASWSGLAQVFRYDLTTGETVCASLAPDGQPGNAPSSEPSVSRDGRSITFTSVAHNLYLVSTDAASEVFVRDTVTGKLRCASADSAGSTWTNGGYRPSMSADGTRVAFLSDGDFYNAGYLTSYVYVRDLSSGATTIASTTPNGTLGDGSNTRVALSGDGRWVAFISSATNLVSGDTNESADVFVRGPIDIPPATVRDAAAALRVVLGLVSPDWRDTLLYKSAPPRAPIRLADAVRLLRRALFN